MIVYGHFEWDIREAAKNLATHGVSFKEATTVFADENCTVSGDAGSPLQAIGVSQRGRPLVVLHQRGSRVRILGAELYVPEAKKPPPRPTPPATTGVRANSWRAAARAAGQQPTSDPEQRR